MKFQKDPSRARMIALLSGASQVAIDEISCEGIGARERHLVEAVRDELADIVRAAHHSEVGEEAPALDEIAERIGGALRRLNSQGLYLYAQPRLDGPIGAMSEHGGGQETHTVLIRAIRAQQAAA
jgi:hypothetical protein